MFRSIKSMLRNIKPMLRSIKSMLRSIKSMLRSIKSMPRSIKSMPRSIESMLRSIESTLRSIESTPRTFWRKRSNVTLWTKIEVVWRVVLRRRTSLPSLGRSRCLNGVGTQVAASMCCSTVCRSPLCQRNGTENSCRTHSTCPKSRSW